MKAKIPLVEKNYILEKFPKKGGLTFVKLPEIEAHKSTPFGWWRVNGKIDDYEIRNYNLQSMGNGQLFLPIKSEIRRKLKKQEGDFVYIVLYEDLEPIDIPEELIICLKETPKVYETFLSYSERRKINILNCIYSAKTDKTKVSRIAKTINEISKKIK